MDEDRFLHLTDVGRDVAEKTYEKHCFFTHLLIDAGVEPKTAEQDACRIAIARAIIKDAPIIVLDEATAFSDPENEYLIQKAFEKLMQDKTVIIIAHRLSTIRNADKIIVVEKGHLIEEGNHDELVATGGRYAQMWNHYTEAIGWKISGKAV